MDDVVIVRKFLGRVYCIYIDTDNAPVARRMREENIRPWLVGMKDVFNTPYNIIQVCLKKKDVEKFKSIVEDAKRVLLLTNNIEGYDDVLKSVHELAEDNYKYSHDPSFLTRSIFKTVENLLTIRNIISNHVILPIRILFYHLRGGK